MLTPLPARPRAATQTINRFTIVASRYNEEFVEAMLAKAQEEIHALEPHAKIEVIHAPGTFEIPFLTRHVIERRKPNAVICLGVILRGETGHANLIASSVSDALCRLSVETSTPIIHEVLLLNDKAQAQERCLGNTHNRGTEAARAAVQILRAARSIVAFR